MSKEFYDTRPVSAIEMVHIYRGEYEELKRQALEARQYHERYIVNMQRLNKAHRRTLLQLAKVRNERDGMIHRLFDVEGMTGEDVAERMRAVVSTILDSHRRPRYPVAPAGDNRCPL